MIDNIGDYTTRGDDMSKNAQQESWEENFFEEHNICGKLEDVQYDELLLQFFSDHPAVVALWLSENPNPRLVGNNEDVLEDMPQSLYRELIVWYRASILRVDSYNKFLEARIPDMPEPEFEHE